MKCARGDLLLYAVTDRRWLGGARLRDHVEAALRGGATFVQLREKGLGRAQLAAEAREIKALCAAYRAPFVVNDDVSAAREVDADGVHVGQSDMEAGSVRDLLGPDKILGVSAETVEQAILAERRGADYLGVGAVFPTGSKDDAAAVSRETLAAICRAVSIPVVAIGGISRANVGALAGSGIAGVAAISAIFAQRDVEGAARELLARAREAVQGGAKPPEGALARPLRQQPPTILHSP